MPRPPAEFEKAGRQACAPDDRTGLDSSDSSARAWMDKARRLDRYRWLLLRQRHSPLGAAIRFVRDASRDLLFGIRARLLCSATTPVPQSCDFLLLHGSSKSVPQQRKRQLVRSLEAEGQRVLEVAQAPASGVIRERMLVRPPYPVPIRYFGYAAYAEWLANRFGPRLVINDRNGSLLAPFLRLSMNRRQGLLVHLAHATTGERSRRLAMNDYDYYFMFGQTSLDALRSRSIRFGSCIAVLAGSYLVDRAYDLPPADMQRDTVLVLGVGPDKEKEEGYRRTYALLRDWASHYSHHQVLFKPHPRSAAQFWRQVENETKNVTVLSANCSLAQALSQASVVINIMSNAVIEAGLAKRPVLLVNLGGDPDIFDQARYFGSDARTGQEIESRLQEIRRNYAAHVSRAEMFAESHLAHGTRGLEVTCQSLIALLSRKPLPDNVDYHELPGTL